MKNLKYIGYAIPVICAYHGDIFSSLVAFFIVSLMIEDR